MFRPSRRALLATLPAGIWFLRSSSSTAVEAPIRIAITPVLVEGYFEVNHQLIAYVGEMLGRKAEIVQRRSYIVQRRSYKEISDLLERGEVDVAFVCGRRP